MTNKGKLRGQSCLSPNKGDLFVPQKGNLFVPIKGK